jgi:hypothetical protein
MPGASQPKRGLKAGSNWLALVFEHGVAVHQPAQRAAFGFGLGLHLLHQHGTASVGAFQGHLKACDLPAGQFAGVRFTADGAGAGEPLHPGGRAACVAGFAVVVDETRGGA